MFKNLANEFKKFAISSLTSWRALIFSIIKLYGCLMFCLISIGIGILFRIAEIYSMKLKHEK